jgi:flagellar L-ring protein precursor FlgH
MFKKVSVLFNLSLFGCATVPSAPPPMATVQVQMVAATPPTTGAIYSAGRSMTLFEDRKARDVGDLITIVLSERMSASSTAATNTKKTSSSSVEAPTIFGGAVTHKGRELLANELGSNSKFEGSGDTSQSNRLEGNLTATVVSRLPNGNLIIQGEKWIQLNQGTELIRVQGIVRAADIAPDNTVPSNRVAEARFSYSGKGAMAQSNVRGWFSRFFDVINPF